MLPGMNSRQMKQAMKKMGVQQSDLDCQEVIIRLQDRDLIFSQPEVARINMMGQETYQIVGEPTEQLRDVTPDIEEADVETVMAQAGVDKERAKEAIAAAKGDLAEAILSLQDDE